MGRLPTLSCRSTVIDMLQQRTRRVLFWLGVACVALVAVNSAAHGRWLPVILAPAYANGFLVIHRRWVRQGRTGARY